MTARNILFLCVANSARSQLAEGLARAWAPPDVGIWSAGSEPSRINPLAVEALRLAGIDATTQRSKGLADVPIESIDTIVTLCADEVCPVVPVEVRRLHWPHDDPAAATGTDRERLEAFCRVRDAIGQRLRDEFGWS